MAINKKMVGAAVQTTVAGSMTPTVPGAGQTFSVADATGYPASGRFVVKLNRGLSDEEKVLCSGRSGTTFTVELRGYDDTTAQTHTAPTCELALDANTVQALIDHADDVESDPHSTKLLNNARHDVTARHTFGAAFAAPAAPPALTPDIAGSAGVGSGPARSDHVHNVPAGAPVAVGTALAEGAGADFARSNHVHTIGSGAINAASMFAAGVVDLAAIAANAVGTSELVDDAVTNAKIADFAINSFNPTWQNVTLGTGGVEEGYYIEVGNLIVGVSGFHLGSSGGNVSGPLVLELPTTLHATFSVPTIRAPWIAAGRMFDSSAGVFYSCTAQAGDPFSTGPILFNFATAGTAGWTTTIPVNWGANDDMQCLFVYVRA